MPLAPTKTYINWHGVTVTPAGGSAIAINHVTSVNVDTSGTAEKFKGDASRFWQVIAVPTQERMLEITTGDIGISLTLTPGIVYTVVAILDDAINGSAAGGGGITVTLVNAVFTKRPIKGQHAKFGDATLSFEAFGATGDTDPLSVVAL